MEAVRTNSTLHSLSVEEKTSRLLRAEEQIKKEEFISSSEAHRIMKCHILGLD